MALIAPWLVAPIQAALDRLYYRDRYDYRRALVAFARELNSDLDLDRLSKRLVERVQETLGVDRMALYLRSNTTAPARFEPVASAGFFSAPPARSYAESELGARLLDRPGGGRRRPMPSRRLSGEEAAEWREAGLFSFVPCVSTDATMPSWPRGRRPHGEPLNSEDMTLLAAVAAQAATALENARLYNQLSGKATRSSGSASSATASSSR